ncbi:putative bifunctional diguanylate cyclase/phosphodiesterase [Kineococcus esterisolvens]|uniref:putative bifunctional diguanylate cyclase/phosphodiesterase n=1 Tax=unclassified Kineococcus TaxID=2621656 RepID=UPI003D7E10B5
MVVPPDAVRALADALLEHPEDALTVLSAVRDGSGRVVDFHYELANGAAERNAGKALQGRRMLEVWAGQDTSLFVPMVELLRDGGEVRFEYEASYPGADPAIAGRTYSSYVRAAGTEHVVQQFRDITELRRAQGLLHTQALHDPLTGLANRRLLLDHLEQALARLERRPSTLAVLYCDVDRFKQINDTFGHGVGDQLLQLVGSSLHAALRPADTIARIGGDEFVVLCEDLEPGATGLDLAERLRSAVPATCRIAGTDVHVGVSVGVTTLTEPVPADRALSEADTALYAAKQDGRRQSRLFSDTMREQSLHRYRTEAGLAVALERGEFELHHQPKVDLASGVVTGAEALLRWRHPTDGLLLPGAFLDVLEDSAGILDVGDWVLREACAEAAGWPRLGSTAVVQVNLAARQIASPHLVGQVRAALARSGLAAERLELEITEGQVLTDLPGAVRTLEEVRALGVRVALDDFGSGYSSLAWLQRLPVTSLKLDRTFLADLNGSRSNSAIVRAVVDLGHALGLQVVGEGVEDEAQLRALRALGVDEVQGFHLGRPVPAAEFRERLRRAALGARGDGRGPAAPVTGG